MDAPTRGILSRLPLAEAVLTLWRWVADTDWLDWLFNEHRGRCYEKVLPFSVLVYLIRDALLEFDGSGQKSFDEGKDRGDLETSPRAAYGKLARIPIPVSVALLSGSGARLREVYPSAAHAQTPLPQSLDGFQVVVFDGKAIKRVARRMKPLRRARGGLLGGRGLIALDMRRDLVIAMQAHPDGDANEVRFVGDLVPEVRRLVPGKRLFVADCAFCDLTQPARFAEHGDAFLIRYHPKVPFFADPARAAREGRDRRGRRYTEEWGYLGSPRNPKRLYVRRIALDWLDENHKPVILITNLLDPEEVPAADLLEVYLSRWGIERVFQQITEVFGLSHLIGTTPEGVIFQFALCLLLYNMIQVVRGVIAAGAERPRDEVSSEKLFEDVQRQVIAWSETVKPEETIAYFAPSLGAERVRERLEELLGGVWRDRWKKSPPRKRKPKEKIKRERTHSSVYRILEAYQQKLKKQRRCLQMT